MCIDKDLKQIEQELQGMMQLLRDSEKRCDAMEVERSNEKVQQPAEHYFMAPGKQIQAKLGAQDSTRSCKQHGSSLTGSTFLFSSV